MPNRPAIASMSLGRAWVHELPEKLSQASRHGFQGIEIAIEDLEHIASSMPGGVVTASNQLSAARQARSLCDRYNLTVISLQPFGFYEGLLDRAAHKRLISEKLPLWLKIVNILGADMILIPANFLGPDPHTGAPRTTGDKRVIVSDLREAAELAARESPPVRIAYEALAWSTHVDTWEECYDIVERVDMPNFGICLDSFNLAGRVYADPATTSMKTPHAEADLKASLARLAQRIDLKKLFYVQIVDGERLERPLVKGHEWYVKEQPSRMTWSRNARLFAFEDERGAYLPTLEVSRAFFDLGFEGWVSMELFSRSLVDPDPKTPAEHARRGAESWHKLVDRLGLKV